MSTSHFKSFLGLDLGRTFEPTALAVLVRPDAGRQGLRPAYTLGHLKRFPPGTPYLAVTAAVRDLLRMPELRGSPLAVDQTGVGLAVAGLVRDGLQGEVDGVFCPVTITAGQGSSVGDTGFLVARTELVGTLQVLLQTRRLLIPRVLPEAGLLVKELENFRAKATLAGAETAEAWREGQNDDLVLAVGMAAWVGEQAGAACCAPVVFGPDRLVAW